MNPKRKQKLLFIICIIMAVSLAASLSLYALKQNINLFYTPSQVFAGQAPLNHDFRIGGFVKKGSVKHFQKSLKVEFLISDLQHSTKIIYQGILPDLFREGQGIVAQGRLTTNGEFFAHEVLAKHDEKYTPPEIQQITLKTTTSL